MKFFIRIIFVITFLFVAIPNGLAQKTEIGILAGGSYYYGDIVNNFQPSTIRPGGGVFVRYHLSKKTSVRVNLMYAKVGGADSNLVLSYDTKWQKDRNLAFYSDIIEVSGMMEYNLIKDQNKGRKIRNRLIPYIFGGIGLFYFDPKAIHPITRKEISLRPLTTDGTSYLPVALAFPLGAGFRFYSNKTWQVGLEIGIRITSTSHLDDVAGNSTYPNPASLPSDDARIMTSRSLNSVNPETQMVNNFAGKPRGKIDFISDVYMIGGLTISYRIWPAGTRHFKGSAVRCPRFY